MIKAFLLGVCVMSVLAFIGICLIDEGRAWGIFLSGPACWAAFFVGAVVKQIRWWKRNHRKRSLLLGKNDCIYAVPVWAADAFRLVKGWDFPYTPCASEKIKKLVEKLNERKDEWDKNDINMRRVSMRYVPKSVWKDFKQIKRKEVKKIYLQSKKV